MDSRFCNASPPKAGNEMRLYTFINFYLSQIQQGIQTAHIVHELFNKYGHIPSDESMLKEWSESHKTIIICNAGADPQIEELIEMFRRYEFPWQDFHEDEGLCGARTGCGVVLPDWIYECERKYEMNDDGRFKMPYYQFFKETLDGVEDQKIFRPGDKYYDLIDLVKSKRLA